MICMLRHGGLEVIKMFSCSTKLSMEDMYGETWWPRGYKTVFMLNSNAHEGYVW